MRKYFIYIRNIIPSYLNTSAIVLLALVTFPCMLIAHMGIGEYLLINRSILPAYISSSWDPSGSTVPVKKWSPKITLYYIIINGFFTTQNPECLRVFWCLLSISPVCKAAEQRFWLSWSPWSALSGASHRCLWFSSEGSCLSLWHIPSEYRRLCNRFLWFYLRRTGILYVFSCLC